MSDLPYKFLTPLAERMRPVEISDYMGQRHIMGEGKILRESIEKDNFPSFILWGPPGSGKTSLSRIIKKKTKGYLVSIAAVTSGIKEVREVIKEAEIRKKSFKQKTILFIDEIHRFNKAQQDAFLPHVEKGTIILIGATTENPYFEVIPALLSRARVYRLNSLESKDIREILIRAVEDSEKGLGDLKLDIEKDALRVLIESSAGDARAALNNLELLVNLSDDFRKNIRKIKKEHVFEALQSKRRVYDKTGEEHYNVVSAFIKSIRGSDPDAALYWLARMLYNGEDPKFIARRMIISAAEDIGLADPFALNIANAAATSVQFVGLPEAEIVLAEAVIYLATSPKSNSVYMGIKKAKKAVEEKPYLQVPMHLINPLKKGLKEMGYGEGYKYPHDFPGHFTHQKYMPDKGKNFKFYNPGKLGHEKKIKARMDIWWGTC